MSRFTSNANRPAHLVASLVALTDQANRSALESAMDASEADADGRVTQVVEHVCRLAVALGVATGEVAWLISELEAAQPRGEHVAEAAVVVAGMQSCVTVVAHTLAELAGRGAPSEVEASAEALRRVAVQLDGLLARL